MESTEKGQTAPFRSGVVAIVGRPNVGKSTLLNVLLQFKLSAVSSRPQTTRHKILGVLSGEGYQACFLDTPGMPYSIPDELNRRLVGRALEAIGEADLVLMLVEPKSPADIERRLVKRLKEVSKPALLAINKIDLAQKPALLPVIEGYSQLYPFLEIVPISALRRDGVEMLREAIVRHLSQGDPLFPPDELTDRPERFLVAEIVREQVFHVLAQEVPYAVAVEIDDFQEQSEEHGGKDYIRAILYVERASQKAILIGRAGDMLKRIGSQARQEAEALLERPVYLELWVKVYPRWRKDKQFLQRIGY
ncbi:MAG: GTPase Era [Chloroflexi bacterium]|nr:GTPase Era [Chloroflexota bacterium]